jgi:hypothetical protein
MSNKVVKSLSESDFKRFFEIIDSGNMLILYLPAVNCDAVSGLLNYLKKNSYSYSVENSVWADEVEPSDLSLMNHEKLIAFLEEEKLASLNINFELKIDNMNHRFTGFFGKKNSTCDAEIIADENAILSSKDCMCAIKSVVSMFHLLTKALSARIAFVGEEAIQYPSENNFDSNFWIRII